MFTPSSALPLSFSFLPCNYSSNVLHPRLLCYSASCRWSDTIFDQSLLPLFVSLLPFSFSWLRYRLLLRLIQRIFRRHSPLDWLQLQAFMNQSPWNFPITCVIVFTRTRVCVRWYACAFSRTTVHERTWPALNHLFPSHGVWSLSVKKCYIMEIPIHASGIWVYVIAEVAIMKLSVATISLS